MHFKRIISLLLMLCMVFTMIPVSVLAESTEIASGTCGDNLTWVLDGEGVLTIAGTGAMAEYYSDSSVPWYSVRDSIKKIEITSGVTNITDMAFRDSGVLEVIIPGTVKSVGWYAFEYCDNLTDVYYELTETEWNQIEMEMGNDALLNATMHFGDGTIITDSTPPVPEPLGTPVEVIEQGDGTAEHPYRITSEEEFALISLDPDAYYIAGADFTVSSNHLIDFFGVFNGNHHVITVKNQAAQGIFRTNDGVIYNLNVVVSGNLQVDDYELYSNRVGFISSINYQTIRDCTVQGNIHIKFPYYLTSHYSVGGVAGANYGDIIRCWNAVNISTNAAVHTLDVGGIAGYHDGTIEQCINTGTIDATMDCSPITSLQNSPYYNFFVGGIVGQVEAGTGRGHVLSSIQAGSETNSCYLFASNNNGDAVGYHNYQYGFIIGREYYWGIGDILNVQDYVEDCSLASNSLLNSDIHDLDYTNYIKRQYLSKDTNYPTLNYSEIKEWWSELDRSSDNDDAVDAEPYSGVRYLKKWDAETNTAYFGRTNPVACQVTDETDTSFLANVQDMVGRYVLVESKAAANNVIAPDTLISIEPVESYIGTIHNFDTDTVTIDDTTWPLGKHVGLLFFSMDTEVLYHIYDGIVVGVDEIKSVSGLLDGWDATSGKLSVYVDGTGELAVYELSRDADATLADMLSSTETLVPITLKHDSQGLVYHAIITDEVRKQGYSLRAYSVDQSLSLGIGKETEIICSLYYNDELVSDWAKPVFSISNSEVLSVSACEKIESGYCFTLSALTSGRSSLIITDGDSGAKLLLNISVLLNEQQPYSYMIDDVPSFYPNVFGDDEILTNFYNCGGLYVNKFPTELTKVDNQYVLEFDVYNSLAMYGSVDIYDNTGNWIKSYRIDKHTSPQGLWDTAKGAYFLVKDALDLRWMSYTAASYTTVTHVSISVPEGGYFTISTNYAKSPGTFLYNAIDYMLLAAKEAADFVIDDNGLKNVQNATLEKLLSSPEFANTFYKQFSQIALNAGAEAATGGYGALAGALTVHAGELFQHLNVDFWGIVSICCGVGEEVFLALTPMGMGAVLKAMFEFAEFCDVSIQTVQIGRSMTKSYITMYTPEATGKLTMNGVTVYPDEGVLPDNAVAQVFRIANRDALVISDAGLVDVYEEYNISFSVDGSEVQPDGNVTVKIPVPDDYLEDECIVLHQQADGSWQVIDSVIEDGFIVFVVDHFSCFAVAPVMKNTGTCGSKVYWKLTDNGELIIIGSGAIKDYSSTVAAPWSELSDSIQSVRIGKGITAVGNYAFYGCDALSSVLIADSVTRIGNAAFCFCSKLTNIDLPDNLSTIGDSAFQDCIALTDLEIPDTVTNLGDNSTFYNCESLKAITLPSGISKIGATLFAGCTSLTEIMIPEGVKTISSDAFYGCSSLEEIEIPQTVTALGGGAFAGCSSLKKITLPEKITDLDGETFSGCAELTEITIPDNVDYLGNKVFAGCTNLANIELPDNLQKIGSGAFSNCISLLNISLPDKLEIIGEDAFEACRSLEKISIPASVIEIGRFAFLYDRALKEIWFEGDAPESMHPHMFTDVSATVYYPAGNETWTTDVFEDFGGTYITWVPYCNEHDNYEINVIPPTCTEQGYTNYTCSVCGNSYNCNFTDPTGHSYEESITAPTCSEYGYTTYSCSICSYSYKDTYVDALGHDWDNGVVTREPTETTEGERLYTCRRCSATKHESIPTTEHTHSYTTTVTAPTCTEQGYTTYTCICGDSYIDNYTDPLGHDWEGLTCQRCGEVNMPFVDVPDGAFFYKPVIWAVEQGITNGYGSADTFAPDVVCNRGQVVTFLWRAAGQPEPSNNVNPFTDIKESDYFYKAVLWAVEEGITAGYGSDTIFNPNGSCTRGQVATFLWRFFDQPQPASTENPFNDVKSSEFYYTAVLWAAESGITAGYGNAYTFAPNMACNRGQVVTFLYRAMN